MSEEEIHRLIELMQKTEVMLARHKYCQEYGALFSEDLYMYLAATTYKYFRQPPAHPALTIESTLDEFELHEALATDKDVKFLAQGCFEYLYNLLEDFLEHELPPNRKFRYRKREEPSFTDEAVFQYVKNMTQKYTIPDKEDRQLLFKYTKEDFLVEEVYEKFETAIFKVFKKLAFKYFPDIIDLSATGLREVDYCLYMHKEMVKDNIYVEMDSRVSVSAEVSIDDFNVSLLNI